MRTSRGGGRTSGLHHPGMTMVSACCIYARPLRGITETPPDAGTGRLPKLQAETEYQRSDSGRSRPKSPTAIPKSNVFSPSYASTATLCRTIFVLWERLPVGIILTIIVFWATGKGVVYSKQLPANVTAHQGRLRVMNLKALS